MDLDQWTEAGKNPDGSKDSSRPATVDHRGISSSGAHIVVEFSRVGVHEGLIR